jgi:hypothetical protein
VLADPVCNKAQGLITGKVSAVVIELFEIVHVDPQQDTFRLPNSNCWRLARPAG